MSIETTISIHMDNYELLKEIAESNKISISKIISQIISLLSDKEQKFINTRFTTAYQQKDKGNYCRLHVYLSEPDFSVAQDLRLFLRSSFSLLIAEALKFFYKELIHLLEGTDNYPHQIHCKIYILDQATKCFKHYWGMPPIEDLEAG